jgi:competence protein ComGC
MDRLTSNRGFMLLEVCMTIMIISIMTLIFLPCCEFREAESYTFGDAYLETQSRAIAEQQPEELEREPYISFNEKGNVSQAMTLHLGNKEIVIELGGGRLVYR